MRLSASEAWSSLQYQTDVQGRFQFSEEIKDSSLKSLVVFIIAKRRVKRDTGWLKRGRGMRHTICSSDSGSNHAVRFCSLVETAHFHWKWLLTC